MKDCEFHFDDIGERCWWDAQKQEWIAESELKFVSKRMRKLIEKHPEFRGWKRKCPECLAAEHCCDCE